MNRREVLQRSALVLGYALTGSTLAGILNGCKASPELTYKPDFFNEDQARLVSEMAEIIIPRTNTPGAKDAGVPSFIDSMVKDVYNPEEREAFLKGLAEFDGGAKKIYGNLFVECSPEDQVAYFKKHHDAAVIQFKGGSSSGWWGSSKSERPFVLKVKELTIAGFFTSEPGATQVLKYEPVPGPYKGCVPYSEVGKQWAT